jgi:hypothetical protein
MHARFIFVMGLLSLYGIISIMLEQQNLVLRRSLSQQDFRLDALENQVVQGHVELNVQLSPSHLPDTEITPQPQDPPRHQDLTEDFVDD